ncbi:hypothetical protein C0J52_21452 [Blattella germanica]|nr:hypothetical protein C0J52_21452 [Blattella germanica]
MCLVTNSFNRRRKLTQLVKSLIFKTETIPAGDLCFEVTVPDEHDIIGIEPSTEEPQRKDKKPVTSNRDWKQMDRLFNLKYSGKNKTLFDNKVIGLSVQEDHYGSKQKQQRLRIQFLNTFMGCVDQRDENMGKIDNHDWAIISLEEIQNISNKTCDLTGMQNSVTYQILSIGTLCSIQCLLQVSSIDSFNQLEGASNTASAPMH